MKTKIHNQKQKLNRPYKKLLLFCVLFGCVCLASPHSYAQNEDNRGFFGIFNKSDQKSNAAPLFLDRPSNNTSPSSSAPFDLNRGRSQTGITAQIRNSNPSTEELNQANLTDAVSSIEMMVASYNSQMEEYKGLLEQRAAMDQGTQGAQEGQKADNRRLVYDPHKFDRRPGETDRKRPIFNTQR